MSEVMGETVPEGGGSNGEGPVPPGPILGQSIGEVGVCRSEVLDGAGGQKSMEYRGCEGLHR